MKTTRQHQNWWAKRQVDWKKDYLETHDHPHRELIVEVLKQIEWRSLFEIGMASGPNLLRIHQSFPKSELGGADINDDAVATARENLPFLKLVNTAPAHNLFVSEKSVDVTLTDMTLIYIGPLMIKKVLKEIERITRKSVVFCEFHHESLLKRWGLRLAKYNAYNYKRLLSNMGWTDIQVYKIPEDKWPGGEPQKTFGHIITADI